MTTRKLLSLSLAAALLSAPFAGAANAATSTARHPAHHAAAKPMKPGHRTASTRAAPRDAGSSAVDSLNEQSLARARGTAQ